MNRATIQNTLHSLQTQPTKSLGQNFLHDEAVAQWIVDQLDLQPEDHLVEVGPGLGALTEFAIDRCRSTTLIEKDGRLAAFLKERFAEKPNVEVRHQDALEYDLRGLFPHGPTKVLGNLPYYVSSQVLFAFTAEPSPVGRLVFTLQKEMAERLSAEPSTKDYGAITLIVGRRWKVQYVRTLPGSVFLPAPNVESGVIVLTPRPADELPDCDGRLFSRLVKEGFSQRRKMLRKMLAQHELDWTALCAAVGVEETVRGEALSLRQWVDLTRFVEAAKDPEKFNAPAQDVHGELFDVVDDENRVTGQATRHEVHTQKLKHRAVHIFVFNKHGDLFLQKRSRFKDANPGRWDSSAAGHLNAGCDYEESAQRELREELGIDAPLEPVGELPAMQQTGWEFVRLYKAEHNGPFNWPRAEIESGLFFPVDVIDRWVAERPHDFSNSFLQSYGMWRESGNL